MMLILSIAALVLGPFVYEFGRTRPIVRQLFDGLVFITIAGIVAVHIVPAALTAGGNVAFVFLLLGLAFPIVLERRFHDAVPEAHGFILVLAALGMTVHAALDGVALLPGSAVEPTSDVTILGGSPLALSVVLHRLPVGMAIWWSLRPAFGRSVALGAFALIIGVTIAAYYLAEPLIELAEAASIAWFQAFVAGSLVHVVAFGVSHEHPGEAQSSQQGWPYRVGILLGLFLIFTVPQAALHH